MIEDTIAEGIPIWKRIVEDAGGLWVGVQMPIFGDGAGIDCDPVCLFSASHSKTPMYLSIYDMTEENVKQKLGIPTVSKKTRNSSRLKMILDELHKVAKEIEIRGDEVEDLARQIQEGLKNAEK